MSNLEDRRQKFFQELQETTADQQRLQFQLAQLTEASNHRIGYSHSLLKAGDRLVTLLDHRVPSIQVSATDKSSGTLISFVVPAEALHEVSAQTEEQASIILTSSVVDTAVRTFDQSGYQFDDNKPENDKRAIRKVFRLFESFQVDEDHNALSRRDQVLIALLGSGYLTGKKVDLDENGGFIIHPEYLGENYLDKRVIYTLAHALYRQRYTLPESVVPAFNYLDKLHYFFNATIYQITKTVTSEFPHTGYDALITYHLKTVLFGQQPDIVLADDTHIDDFGDYLGG